MARAGADESEQAVAAMKMPEYVVTSSPTGLSWARSHQVAGSLDAAFARLTAESDGELVVFGAATLVRGLAEHDLVDEYRLLTFAVVLGVGKRMFGPQAHPARFRLTDSTVSESGVSPHSFVRDRSVEER